MPEQSRHDNAAPSAISVGGNVAGSALVTGRNNSVVIANHPPESRDHEAIVAALRELGTAMNALTGPRAGTAQRESLASLEAASVGSPDKDAVGAALEASLKAARNCSEFVEVAGRLTPLVTTVAGWLGEQWRHLASLLT
jgi:hypothetical protein